MTTDRDTIDTMVKMFRYIDSDRKIANHLGITEERVAQQRKRRIKGQKVDLPLPTLKAPRAEVIDRRADMWMKKTRASSDVLAKAIQAMYK